MHNPPSLALVVPCYNEAEVLPETVRQLGLLLDRMEADGLVAAGATVWLVDDGSRDATWPLIATLAANQAARWRGIRLSRNRGHQNALMAGLATATGDVVVSLDADLQDDIAAIPAMLRAHAEGCDIVYAVRDDRAADTWFKRRSAVLYYRLLRLLGVEMQPDHADFRLLSRRALDALARYSEVNLFLRAIVPLLGFRTATVSYRRAPRFAGVTKYPLRRMLALAIDGVTSFTMRPLRLITLAGGLVSLLAFTVATWALGIALLTPDAVPGWTSLLVPLSLIGGLQLLALGVIGEYVGKIYLEVKRRPRFEIAEIL